MDYEFEEKTKILMMIADSECSECYRVSVHEFMFKLIVTATGVSDLIGHDGEQDSNQSESANAI